MGSSSILNVAAYVSPLRAYDEPTGVGQHILGMFVALQERDDVRFHLVTPRGVQEEAAKLIKSHRRSRIISVPWPDRALRLATTWCSIANLDPWLSAVDWVYSPVEQPVTTSRKLVVTVHDVYGFEPDVPGVPHRKPPGLSWRRRMKRILDRADLISAASEFTRTRIIDLFGGRSSERIVVIGNGGAEFFEPTACSDDDRILRGYNLNAGSYVLFPASLTWRKGGDILLDVARLAHADRVGLRFAVIGRRHDPDLLTALKQTLQRVPDLPVSLLGYVPRYDLAVLYRNARAALFPSRYEGFGIPVVEALKSGCPILTSEQPALLEVARGKATVTPLDPAAILATLETVRERADAKTCLVESVRDWTWANCADRLLRAMR